MRKKITRIGWIVLSFGAAFGVTEALHQANPLQDTVSAAALVVPSGPLAQDPNLFVSLSKHAVPAVVNIATSMGMKTRLSHSPLDLPEAHALGTGFIIKASKGEAILLTN